MWAEQLESRHFLSVSDAPTNLGATKINDTSLTLAWIDNSTRETGYQVFRSGDNGATWKMIALTAANATTLKSGGLGEGARYLFRLRGTLAGGAFASFSTSLAVWTRPTAPEQL